METHRNYIVKCYIGFCTPTCTQMDHKKKKKKDMMAACIENGRKHEVLLDRG
jgi:hypothetical protein